MTGPHPSLNGPAAACPERCPGCSHRHLSAIDSEARKRRWLTEALAPWSGALAPVRGVDGDARWAYRDRASLAAAWTCGGWRFGLLRGDDLIPIESCPVHSPRVIGTVRALQGALPPGPKFPLARMVQSGGQVTLVCKTAHRPDTRWVTPAIHSLKEVGVEGLWLHLFPALGRRTFQKRGWHRLWGSPRSSDGLGLLHGPTAFQQLLPSLYREALEQAERFLAPGPGDLVLDLYCGAGASIRRWLGRGATVFGVELGGEAVEYAALNAPGAEILRGTCEARLPQLDAFISTRAERPLLYANPPRTGLEPAVRTWIAERCRPGRMAYLSCSAGTLRRDLAELEKGGMVVTRILPYDFFPQTHHVETLVLLSGDRQG